MALREALCHICGYSESHVPKMFYFPKKLEKSKLWQESMGVKYVGESLHNYRICSRHFTPESYQNALTYTLNRNAVPKLFPMASAPELVHSGVTFCGEIAAGTSKGGTVMADSDSDMVVADVLPAPKSRSCFRGIENLSKAEATPRKQKLIKMVHSKEDHIQKLKKICKSRAHDIKALSDLDNSDVVRNIFEVIELVTYEADEAQNPVDIRSTPMKAPTRPDLSPLLIQKSREDCKMEQLTCRTCLNTTDKKKRTEISQICCIDKTIKDVIVWLVPEMASTVLDNEWVCKNCLHTLRSCMRFIERCLEIEAKNSENQQSKDIDRSEPEEKNIEMHGNVLIVNEFDQIDIDHNYSIKLEPEDCDNGYTENTMEANTNSPKNSGAPTQLPFDSSIPDNVELCILDDRCTSPKYIFYESLSADKGGKVEYKDKIDLGNGVLPQAATSSKHLDSETSQLSNAKDDKFTCHTCSEKFSCNLDYELHLQIHPGFICHHCGQSLTTEMSYKRHMRIHAGDGLKLCDSCGKRFVSMSALKLHIASVHKPETWFMCDKCPKTYKHKFKLNRHMKRGHEGTREKCQECGKLFSNKENRLGHYRLIHLKLKPYTCKVCGKEFGRSDYLRNHMHVHTGEPRAIRPNSVPQVSKRVRSGLRLKQTGKPVNCKVCGKSVSSLNNLKAHLQTHVKIKRHKCKYCEITFTATGTRNRHQLLHEADPENKFRCNICWKRMKTEQEKDEHVQVHYNNRLPNHTCDICGEKFHRKYLMHNHQLEMHTVPEDIEKAQQEIVEKNLLEYAL